MDESLSFPEPALITVAHPLDPLSAGEMESAVRTLRQVKGLGNEVRFPRVDLREPSKDVVRAWDGTQPVDREAVVTVLSADCNTYEAVVSIRCEDVTSWRRVPGVQPPISPDETAEVEDLVKGNLLYREALIRRGVEKTDLVMIDTWAVGNFGPDESSTRLAKALSWLRSDPSDNGYAHPIDGLIVVVDLNRMTVLRVDDIACIPIPPEEGRYRAEDIRHLRDDLSWLEIEQADGPSFDVEGYAVRWQKWQFRIGFSQREGLILHSVAYEDGGRLRPILYRASYSEMVVPYGDPGPTQYFKNAFDIGEYGIGSLVNSLERGCDCLGSIYYFDAAVCNTRGQAKTVKNAVCLHEEDDGILWKHYDWRTDHTEVRRSRRLVVSSISTVGNYEYGFFWYFYQDGSIEAVAKLTGILQTGALPPGGTSPYGELVARQLYAPNHQHFFNVRLDFSIDGEANSIYEVETEADAIGGDNPHGNAFRVRRKLLTSELDAQRVINPLAGRSWVVVNPRVKNRMGTPTGYQLLPGNNILPFAHRDASICRRAGFITKHLWVTPYERGERYAAGEYPNQHSGGAGLLEWTAADRRITETDIVVWYTFGVHHIPRLEDWPVVRVESGGFQLRPIGFFDRSAALDVPPPAKHPRSHPCTGAGEV